MKTLIELMKTLIELMKTLIELMKTLIELTRYPASMPNPPDLANPLHHVSDPKGRTRQHTLKCSQ